MTLPLNPPNTILLSGPVVKDSTMAAKEVITPGMLIELDTTANVTRWKKSTQSGLQNSTFAQQALGNKGVNDTYAIGDLVEAAVGGPGTVIWGLIASGANIAKGAKLSDNGDGTFKAAAGITNARSLETVDNSAGAGGGGPVGSGLARLRVEFL